MSKVNYMALQNGSDIRGVAIAGVPGEEVNLTDEAIENIVTGFVYLLSNKLNAQMTDLRVSVGRDSRLSGEHISNIVCKTLQQLGVMTLDTGLASTPAMFMSTKFEHFNCHGAIMVTASHLPKNRNGFKFFSASGGVSKETISKILKIAQERADKDGASSDLYENEMRHRQGAFTIQPIEHMDLMSHYCEELRKQISIGLNKKEAPLKGMKILVDAGNGVGGFYATRVLKPLGATIDGSLYLEPDGHFPNHIPNPEKKGATDDIIAKVKETSADLALVFDTDVDRVAAIDENGSLIARNAIIALAASLVYKAYPSSYIVTDSITSPQLTEFLRDKLNLKHYRYKRGYRNVIDKAKELEAEGKSCPLAIETSGHAAFKENYFLDDGAFLATKIVIEAARLKREDKGISSLISRLREPAESREIRLPLKSLSSSNHDLLNESELKENGDMILKSLKDWAERDGKSYGAKLEKPNYEGVRVNFPKGWLLLRMSLHDPIMPLNIESTESGGVDEILGYVKPVLEKFDFLDTSELMCDTGTK